MQISFFEEYPTDDSLSKLKLIPFKTNLYIASHSTSEFLILKKEIKTKYKNVEKIIYWPILKVSEGYWMSAFSKTKAIKRILKELKDSTKNFSVLWDAELPLLNKKLFITEIFHFFENRKIIFNAINNQNIYHPIIVTAFPKNGINKFISNLACASFSSGNFHYIDMLYSSLLKIDDKKKYLLDNIRKSKNKFKEYSVALGLIGRGIEDSTTPLISYNDLWEDLKIAKEERVKEAILYRLGGLNKQYLDILRKFI